MEDCNMNHIFARRLQHQQMKGKLASQPPQENIENENENSFPVKKLCFDEDELPAFRPFKITPSPVSDRYIPLRFGCDLETKFRLLPETRGFGGGSGKGKKGSGGSTSSGGNGNNGKGDNGSESGRGSEAIYSNLLHNEIIGRTGRGRSGFSDGGGGGGTIGGNSRRSGYVQDENSLSPGLFQFSIASPSPRSAQPINIEAISPYSLSPVSTSSQLLLRCPRKQTRRISRIPFKVLDAPELQDDFYLNLVDWSSQNVLSVGLANCVYLWSATTSQVTRLCDLSSDANSVTSVAWNERGNLVAVGTQHGYVEIWDAGALKQLGKMQGHSARVGTLAWNGDILSSGSRDRLILQRDMRISPSDFERRLSAHRQEVCGLKWSPDNQCLASGGNDNKLHLWNMHSTTPIGTYDDHIAAVKAISWSPHHHGLLASGGGTADRTIRFWNTLTGQAVQSIDTGSQVCNLAWSKHSSELVSTHGYSQNQILVWKYPSLTQVSKLTGHSYRVLYLAVSPCGESIVTGAGDETLRFWNVFSKATYHQRHSLSRLSLFQNIR